MGEIADALRQADRSRPIQEPRRRAAPIAEPRSEREKRVEPPDSSDAHSPAESPAESHARAEPHARRDAARTPEAPPANDRHSPIRRLLELKGAGSEQWGPARIAVADPFGDATQQYRRLAFRVRDLADARDVHSIVVTSAQAGDGKTTTSCNLAIQLVRLDQNLRVVLVDLDLRRASIAAAFGIDVDVSVDEVLRGERPVEDAIFETDVPGLSILALAHSAPEPEWLLAHPNLATMIHDLERRFDFVLIDTPPVLAVSDAQVILRHASAGLFVGRAGRTPVKAIRRAVEHLPTRKMLGSFLNSSPSSHGLTGYSYYGTPPPSEGGEDSDERAGGSHG